MEAHVAGADPDDLPHALFNGRVPGVGGTWGESQRRLCFNKDALGGCKSCSKGLDTDRPKPFWVCYPWETWLAVLLSASDRERKDLSRAKELIEQIPEFWETDLWGLGGGHHEPLVRVCMGV